VIFRGLKKLSLTETRLVDAAWSALPTDAEDASRSTASAANTAIDAFVSLRIGFLQFFGSSV
jgi:hypothetical protein